MGKVAFVFSGQGAQAPGMGRSLSEASAAASAVFALADGIRQGTSRQCFEGTPEELSLTLNTQPCVYAVDMAAAQAMSETGITPDGVAGFSLGELAALSFAGAFSPADGFRLVCRRAALMQEAAERAPGAMAAVLKLSDEQVEALCVQYGVYPVNYNCPGQLVVAGESAKLADFIAAAAEKRGKAIPLAVSGAFHSPFMRSAADEFAAALTNMSMQSPRLPVYANATALPYADDMRGLLSRQMYSPVLWRRTIENMRADGFDTFIEAGPGKTLCGLIRKILPDAAVFNVQDAGDLRNISGRG